MAQLQAEVKAALNCVNIVQRVMAAFMIGKSCERATMHGPQHVPTLKAPCSRAAIMHDSWLELALDTKWEGLMPSMPTLKSS